MEELEEAVEGLQDHLYAYSKHIPDAAIKLYAKLLAEPLIAGVDDVKP